MITPNINSIILNQNILFYNLLSDIVIYELFLKYNLNYNSLK